MSINCSIWRECGGCSQIQIPYAQQLQAKQTAIETMFAPLLEQGVGNCYVAPILGMDQPREYRNKIVSPFAPMRKSHSLRSLARTGRAGKLALRKSEIACGLYAAGTHKLIACENCPVEHPVGRQAVAAVHQIMAKYGMAPYNEDTGTGFVRHLVVRVGQHSGEVLATLVTNGSEFAGAKNFCRELVKRVPAITTIVQNINTRSTNVIFGEEERVLYGPGFILDTLCGLSFRISSTSFWQTNALQAEVLYKEALRGLQTAGFVPAGQPPVLLDAYCGTGTLGLVAAAAMPKAQVIGVDNVEAAIVDARQNAQHNGRENARFVCEDAGFFMREYAAAGHVVDAVLMDPPRAGASEEFLASVAALAPKMVVYISCNPETQVRDVQTLVQAGYNISQVQPVDMFPHTSHIENVVTLQTGLPC